MKITMSETRRCSKSEMGVGRVWEGQTEFGTPVKVLVSGLAANTDEPAMQAQFDREHDALSYASDGPVCPDCGELMELHSMEIGEEPLDELIEHRQVAIDLYDVMVRWLMASDDELVKPGVSEELLAEHFRTNLERLDPDAHRRLTKAAGAVAVFIAERFVTGSKPAQPEIKTHHRPGHA